jgi:hypothetical protein
MTMHKQLKAAAAVTGLMLLAASGPAGAAMPQDDPQAIFTLEGENSTISTAKLTDRYYTNGVHVGWTSPTGYAPALGGIGRTLFGDGQQRVSIDISQQMFTPADTATRTPPPGDRPYAGLLLLQLSQSTETDWTRGNITVDLGVMGPSALAKQVQNTFHDIIGQGHDSGWNSQLRDEPVFNTELSQTWRVPAGTLFGLDTDALPQAGVELGTWRVAADAMFNVRIGSGLDADFGAPRIRPLGGGTAFRAPAGFAWYVFAGAGGQAVAHDATLQGNTFRSSTGGVTLTPLVGQAQLGFAVIANGMRITYTQLLQTQEFKHQHGGPHQFGALSLAVRF